MSIKTKLKLHLKKGGLHEALGKPEDKQLSGKDIAIKDTDSAHMKKMKQFALNSRKWKH